MDERARPAAAIREMVADCWCSETRHKFGLVFILTGVDTWELHHSFLTADSWSGPEQKRLSATGNFRIAAAFNGCKYCEAFEVWQCSKCGAINCRDDRQKRTVNPVICVRCRFKGILSGTVSAIGGACD